MAAQATSREIPRYYALVHAPLAAAATSQAPMTSSRCETGGSASPGKRTRRVAFARSIRRIERAVDAGVVGILRRTVMRHRPGEPAGSVDGECQIAIDMGVHTCQPELDARDGRRGARFEERLPAARRFSVGQPAPQPPEVEVRKLDAQFGKPSRILKAARHDPGLYRFGHLQIQPVEAFQAIGRPAESRPWRAG